MKILSIAVLLLPLTYAAAEDTTPVPRKVHHYIEEGHDGWHRHRLHNPHDGYRYRRPRLSSLCVTATTSCLTAPRPIGSWCGCQVSHYNQWSGIWTWFVEHGSIVP